MVVNAGHHHEGHGEHNNDQGKHDEKVPQRRDHIGQKLSEKGKFSCVHHKVDDLQGKQEKGDSLVDVEGVVNFNKSMYVRKDGDRHTWCKVYKYIL